MAAVIAPFLLERYFAEHEFATPHLLCASDLETLPMRELLALADADGAALWDGLRLGYTETTGHPALRAELAALYATVDADDVVTFAGASEAITCLVSGLVGPGDHAIVTWPGYQSLYEVARAAGADVTTIELHAGRTAGRSTRRRSRAALRPPTRLVVVNAPHNPTGMLPDARHLAARSPTLTADAGATLLCDEVYRLLEHDEADRLPAGADLGEHVVSIGVLSKSYGLAGLRIGWLATRSASIRAAAVRVKDYGSMCNAAPAEILGVIALRAADPILERNRALVRAQPGAGRRAARGATRSALRGCGRGPARSASRGCSTTSRSTGFCDRLRARAGRAAAARHGLRARGQPRPARFRARRLRRRPGSPGRLPADGVACGRWPTRALRSAAAAAAR